MHPGLPFKELIAGILGASLMLGSSTALAAPYQCVELFAARSDDPVSILVRELARLRIESEKNLSASVRVLVDAELHSRTSDLVRIIGSKNETLKRIRNAVRRYRTGADPNQIIKAAATVEQEALKPNHVKIERIGTVPGRVSGILPDGNFLLKNEDDLVRVRFDDTSSGSVTEPVGLKGFDVQYPREAVDWSLGQDRFAVIFNPMTKSSTDNLVVRDERHDKTYRLPSPLPKNKTSGLVFAGRPVVAGFSPSGEYAMSVGADGSLHRLSLSNGETRSTKVSFNESLRYMRNDADVIFGGTVHDDGSLILIHRGGRISELDADFKLTRARSLTKDFALSVDKIEHVDFSPDRGQAVIHSKGKLALVDFAAGTAAFLNWTNSYAPSKLNWFAKTLVLSQPETTERTVFSRDLGLYTSGSGQALPILFKFSTRDYLTRFVPAFPNTADRPTFDIYDLDTGKAVAQLNYSEMLPPGKNSLVFLWGDTEARAAVSPDGSRVAVWMQFWNFSNSSGRIAIFNTHSSELIGLIDNDVSVTYGLLFSPDNKYLATTNYVTPNSEIHFYRLSDLKNL